MREISSQNIRRRSCGSIRRHRCGKKNISIQRLEKTVKKDTKMKGGVGKNRLIQFYKNGVHWFNS